MALVEGLGLCKTLGCKNVETKGYSAIVINSIRKRSPINWKLDSILSRSLLLY